MSLENRGKRNQLANLLFAGGGLTAAALLTSYQLNQAPQSGGIPELQPITQSVTDSVRFQEPEMPEVCEELKPIVRDPGVMGGAVAPTYEPPTPGRVAAPRPPATETSAR
jgi:hypothetical protein